MPIPDYQTIMLPLLKFAGDSKEHSLREAAEVLAEHFSLSDDERSELLPSGAAYVFASRVGWAKTYMKQAGLLLAPKRGIFQISADGLSLLQTKPQRIDNSVLDRYEAFVAFLKRSKSDGSSNAPTAAAASNQEQTPEDAMAAAYQRARKELEAELLDQIKSASPTFFERLVIDLLVSMGYGGSRQDAGKAIGKSGDGGIDGMIKEDRLGLDVIYLQAKRWESVVGRPEIQKFAGALQGQRANKGVFITTSSYTKEALDYANTISSKIILIDGAMLTGLMVDHNVAVARVGAYEVKKIDSDYFEGE